MANQTHPSPRQILAPAIIGNILEWYDFALYGYFATIISKLFFPAPDPFTSLLTTFSVFAVGFLMRPLGAVIFGHFGDKVGRKKTLAASVILMAVPTTLMGLLPTHTHIGVAAGILLTICRLLQGLAIGGEFSGSIVFITEHSPNHCRGLYGSWAMFSAFAGLLLGSAIGALVSNVMPIEALNAWGWRVPFISGIFLGIIGLYLRLNMPETPAFTAAKKQKELVSQPIFHAFRYAWKPMIIGVGVDFLPAMAFYLLFVYLPTYMNLYLQVPLKTALIINSISMAGIILVIPFAGLLSDTIGRKPILTIGAISFIVFSYPLFLLLQQGNFASLLLAQICFTLLMCLVCAAIPATLVELMVTNVRYTAMSLPYNFSNAVFGGTAPLVATYLIAKSNNHLAPAFYLIAAGIVMLIFIFFLEESHRKELFEQYPWNGDTTNENT